MRLLNPNTPAKFVVEVQNVKEVTVTAEVDRFFWQERLQEQGLFPFVEQGKAQLIISGTELDWMGKRSNEITIGLVICERPAGDTPDGLFLVDAFNSSRLFAWVERTFFSTPYFWGRIAVAEQLPAQIRLGNSFLHLQMNHKTPPMAAQEEIWQGKIYLPHTPGTPGQFFVAKLAGYTEVYPFLPDQDSCQITAQPGHPVFQWLLQSPPQFKEWRIRNHAVHARSRTFRL